MREVVRSNDAVMLGFAQAVLQEAGIYSLLADQHISVMEGAIGAFPRRLLVANEDWPAAHRALSGAGLGASLIDEGDPQV
jgi:Putative prokaryotic signal transducing protein